MRSFAGKRFSATLLAIGAVLFGFCSAPTAAWAKRHHSHDDTYNVIASVDEAGGKIVVGTEHNKDHTTKAVIITKFTEITVDGQKATLHDLKEGMNVKLDLQTDNEAAAVDATHVNK